MVQIMQVRFLLLLNRGKSYIREEERGIMKLLSGAKRRTKFTIINVALFAILLLSMIAAALLHYPPSPLGTENIRCDFKPVLSKPLYLASDALGRFYLHTNDGTLCYDKSWNYVCTFASSGNSFIDFFVDEDRLCFQHYNRIGIMIYDLEGNFIQQLPSVSSKHIETSMQITDNQGETYTLLGGTLFPQVRKSNGEVVWRGSLLGTILKCALTLSVISNLLWWLIYAIETAGDQPRGSENRGRSMF